MFVLMLKRNIINILSYQILLFVFNFNVLLLKLIEKPIVYISIYPINLNSFPYGWITSGKPPVFQEPPSALNFVTLHLAP